MLCWLSCAASHAESVLPDATYDFPSEFRTFPSRPGIGRIVNPRGLIGTVEGYAFGGSEPSVRVAFNILDPGGSGLNFAGSSVTWYMQVMPKATDPFGALNLVPITMPYFASLNAAPRQNGKVVGDAIIALRNLDSGPFLDLTLKDFRACASTELSGVGSCFGSHPTRPSIFEEGTIEFDLRGSERYEMRIQVVLGQLCVNAPCEGFGSSLIDPLPKINIDANPLDYGRPLGFRFEDHYQIEFSPNLLTAVPLPASWALLLGALSVLWRRKASSKSKLPDYDFNPPAHLTARGLA